MTAFIIDISNHNPDVPIEDLARQGFSALILKCSEGTTYKDQLFSDYLHRALVCKFPVAAYHFVHETVSNAAEFQSALIQHMVPKRIPIWLDIEPYTANGVLRHPTRNDAYAIANCLQDGGYTVAGLYCASRPLDAFAWWRAAYLADPADHYASTTYGIQGGDHGSAWVRGVDIWQFCQHGKIDGYTGDIDFSAFRGSRDELLSAGWFYTDGTHPGTVPQTQLPEEKHVYGLARFAINPATYDPNNPSAGLASKIYELWPTGDGKVGSVWINNPLDVYDGTSTVVFDTEAALLAQYPLIAHVVDTLRVR